MTHAEATAFWFGRINFEVRSAAPADLKLERMRALLARLGDPHRRVRTAHVTGTKGKGSTAAMTAAGLRAAGYRVGLFTSPHLVRVEERIQVDGEPIAPGELAARLTEVAAAERGDPVTFFEISTAVGFLHFALRRVEVAVVEVGLGGRFDSTNVCAPAVCAITSVGLDHTAQLGNTVEAIAYQKAGILKRGVPAVLGPLEAGPRAVVARVAREVGSPVVATTPEQAVGYQLGLLGPHQRANAAVAVGILAELRKQGMHVPDKAIRRGLRDVRWPARVELIRTHPAVILDTAHNVPSVEALVAALREAVPVGGTKRAVFAVSADKPYRDMLRVLGTFFDHVHCCKYANPRGVPAEVVAATAREFLPATAHSSPLDAWAAARSASGPDDLVCVTGSVFLAGELDAAVRGAR